MRRNHPPAAIGRMLNDVLRMTTDDFVEAKPRQRAPLTAGKHWAIQRDVGCLLIQQAFQQGSGLVPERADTPFIAFAVQVDAGLGIELDV